MARKPIPKKIREIVYQKYGGHCAYCGMPIEYKDMQVDHINSVYVDYLRGKEPNDAVENLLPACRKCNFYKSTHDIEGFRRKIKMTLEHSCVDTFQAQLAMRLGILHFTPFDKFYFEKIEAEKEK